MFVGRVDLENGSGYELVITPLKGSVMEGQWDTKTDLVLISVIQSGRCCTCRPDDHPNRYAENLNIPKQDAELLAKWLQDNF